MLENQGGIPEKTSSNETSAEAMNPPEEVFSIAPEFPALSQVPPVCDNADRDNYGQEPLTKIVVHRVRAEPDKPVYNLKRGRDFLFSLSDTVRFLSIGFVIAILFVVFVAQRNDVNGPSMETTLHKDGIVIVEMVSKYIAGPKRGDIMTINATGLPGYTKKEEIIKRVVGLPGETVSIKDGSVYINGVLLSEPYLDDGVVTEISGSENNNITLGKDEYYFLGDNRGVSEDSRILGPIVRSRIRAHVIIKIYPFNDMGIL